MTLQLDKEVTVRGLELTMARMDKELATQHLACICPCLHEKEKYTFEMKLGNYTQILKLKS